MTARSYLADSYNRVPEGRWASQPAGRSSGGEVDASPVILSRPPGVSALFPLDRRGSELLFQV
jgi:hypothetical protein